MGFGYVFIGFIFLVNPVRAAFTDWFAFIMICVGLGKLAVYEKVLKYAYRVSMVAVILGVGNLFVSAAELIGFISYQNTVYYFVVEFLRLALRFALQYMIFYGFSKIAVRVGLDRLKFRSYYSILLSGLAFVIQILLALGLFSGSVYSPVVILVAVLIISVVNADTVRLYYSNVGIENENE